MTTLRTLAGTLRSSNAGASRMTFDVMFRDEAGYRAARAANAITPALIASLYGVPADEVKIYDYPPAWTIKVTIPRSILAGNPDDTDIDGKQQHAPLLDIEIPV